MTGPVKLRKRKRSVMLVGFGQLTPEEKEALTHTWSLERWDWSRLRRARTPVQASDGQLLEKLALVRGAYGADAARARALLMQLLLTQQAHEQAWGRFTEANREALMIEVTDHHSYSYSRQQRVMRWTDDLTGPTPPEPGLERSRTVNSLVGKTGWLKKKQNEREELYERHRRDVDVEFLRPHLYRELEPFATTLMARGWEVRNALLTLRKTARDLLWQEQKRARAEHEASLTPAVADASTVLRELESRFFAPASEELEELQNSLDLESLAQAHGQAKAEEWQAYAPSPYTPESERRR